MASLALAFDILARDKGASRTFDKVGDSAEKAGRKGFGFGSAVKAGIGVAAGAIAAAGITSLIKDSISEARESQKVGAITANVIKTTGGAAKVTAGQVGDLATAISNKTGIDDEAVQSASNLLLTFTNVRNEVGKGNDVFNQATQAATDMASAMGKEPKAAAIQLGKALNDPIKGITALSKVGVSFTAQQKDQIKAMVKSGDTLGAQKLILGELNKEFGGTAEASATAGEKMATAFGNFKENIGTALLPVLDKVEGFISTKLIPGIQGVIDILFKGDFTSGFAKAFNISEDSKIVDFLFNVREGAMQLFDLIFKGKFTGGPLAADGAVVQGVLALREGFFKVKDAVTQFIGEFARGEGAGGKFRDILSTIVGVAKDVATWIGNNATTVQILAGAVGGAIVAFKVVSGVVKAYTAVQAALNVVMSLNPIGLVVLAIGALVGAFIVAYKKSETFRDVVNNAWDSVKLGAIQLALVAVGAFRGLVNFYLTMVSTLVTGAAKAFGWVPGLGPKLKAAAANVEGFKTSANAALSKVERDLKIQADTTRAQNAINDLRRNAGKPVTIDVFMKTHYTAGRVNVAGVGVVNAGQRAGGGPVDKGAFYSVGENSDGSWNKTTEIFRPTTSGRVINQAEMRRAMGMDAPAAGGRTDLSESSLQRLASILAGVQTRTSVSVGSVDNAMATGYRS